MGESEYESNANDIAQLVEEYLNNAPGRRKTAEVSVYSVDEVRGKAELNVDVKRLGVEDEIMTLFQKLSVTSIETRKQRGAYNGSVFRIEVSVENPPSSL